MSISRSAFTLIEMLIVISIIGILSGIVIVVINPERQKERAKDGVRMANMAKIAGALGVYYAEKGEYPTSSDFESKFSNVYLESGFLSGITSYDGSTVMFKMPPDESRSTYYRYTSTSGVPKLFEKHSDGTGLCWRPDTEGGRVYIVAGMTDCL